MEYFIKKMWMSVILSILVLATTVTSTYAWYAMNRTNNIEEFDFNINGGTSLKISTDGINFHDELSDIDVKKAVLKKRGIDSSGLNTSDIDKLFSISLEAITPKNYANLSEGFQNIEGSEVSNYSYISFDFYLATNTLDDSDLKTGVRFGSSIPFKADNSHIDLSDMDRNNENFPFDSKLMPNKVKINLVNAVRLGLQSYDVCDIADVTNSSNNPKSMIYDFGGDKPNVHNDVYNFGGIKAPYNMALDVYNRHMGKNISLPQNDRNDVLYSGNDIVTSDDTFINGKMKKFTAYLWLEGWDSDCVTNLQGKGFSFGLSMNAYSA